MSCEPAARFHHRHFVAKYIDGFVEQDVFGVFPRLFGRQFIGEFAFAWLQAIVSERSALLGRVLLAGTASLPASFRVSRDMSRVSSASRSLRRSASFSEIRFFLR